MTDEIRVCDIAKADLPVFELARAGRWRLVAAAELHPGLPAFAVSYGYYVERAGSNGWDMTPDRVGFGMTRPELRELLSRWRGDGPQQGTETAERRDVAGMWWAVVDGLPQLAGMLPQVRALSPLRQSAATNEGAGR